MSVNNNLKKTNEWNNISARHLLSRTLFGFTPADVEYALSKSIDEFVDDELLAERPQPQAPLWVDDTSNNNRDYRTNELIDWLYIQALNQGYSFREKMVLFFHNHFVSEITKVRWPQMMYRQLKLFREYSFGNFKELTLRVTTDPAMLIYLDGEKNRKEDPNENYARELLELFTIGIGNYTENDIMEAARALTGWQIQGFESYFDPDRFDDGIKTFMGQTGNFNHEDIVDIIFQNEETSKFICRKLYKEFVFIEPDETTVSELAAIFRQNNYELKPVLSVLLKSTLFYSEEIIGAKIKSPIEFICCALKDLNIKTYNFDYIRNSAELFNQEILSPPNVKGWEGDKKWISTNTLPARHVFTDTLLEGKKVTFSLLDFARSFPTAENPVEFVEEIAERIFQYPLTQNRKDVLLEVLLDGAAIYDWSTYNENAEARLEAFLRTAMRFSEYQLA